MPVAAEFLEQPLALPARFRLELIATGVHALRLYNQKAGPACLPGPPGVSFFWLRSYDRDAIADEIGRSTRGMMYCVHSASARSAICVNSAVIESFGRSPQ